MIIPMLCVTIFVILVVWFLLPRVARLMIHTPTAISIFVCLSRSEERFSRNAETDLVCRLLLENKNPSAWRYAVTDGARPLAVCGPYASDAARLCVPHWLSPGSDARLVDTSPHALSSVARPVL